MCDSCLLPATCVPPPFLQDEADLEEEERQKLLMDARVRMAVQDLQDHETTC